MRCSDIRSTLQASFSGQPWYGDSVMKKLNRISPEIAFRKPDPRLHSIWQLVSHMIAWREFAIKNTSNVQPFDIEINGSVDWPAIPEDDRARHWEETLTKLNNTQMQLLEILENLPDDLLSEKVPGRNYPFGFLLNGVCQHDIYHLGQIALVHKLLTST